MKYTEVKFWVQKNYPNILIYDSEECKGEVLELLGGEVTVNFLELLNPSAHLVSNTDTSEEVIILNKFPCDIENITALLHEVGHAIEHQEDVSSSRIFREKDSILYNETQAWEGAKKLASTLDIELDWLFAKEAFLTYVSYFGKTQKVSKWMVDFGWMKEEDYLKHYGKRKRLPYNYSHESWKKVW